MKYHPESIADRRCLTASLLAKLDECGFTKEHIEGTAEAVFTREVAGTDGRIKVAVYTTIVGTQVRGVGADAIRVVALYKRKDGPYRGIAKAEKRVNRTGTVEAITDRMYTRMREVYKLATVAERCPNCGAPKFISKAKNAVCADLCWMPANQRNVEVKAYTPRYSNHGRDAQTNGYRPYHTDFDSRYAD